MPTEYAANPGFEVNTADWSPFGNATIVRSTAQARSGVASGLVTSPGGVNAQAVTTVFSGVAPGQVWSVGIWAKWASGTRRSCRCDLIFMNDAGTALESNLSAGLTPTTTGWSQISTLNKIAPAGATRVRIRFVMASPSANDAVYIDDAQIVMGSSLEDPVATGPTFTMWNGTAEVPLTLEGQWNGTTMVPLSVT